jgi:hypothetical protein
VPPWFHKIKGDQAAQNENAHFVDGKNFQSKQEHRDDDDRTEQ